MSYRALAVVEPEPPTPTPKKHGTAMAGGVLLRCKLPGRWARWWHSVRSGDRFQCSDCGAQHQWMHVNERNEYGWRWVKLPRGFDDE